MPVDDEQLVRRLEAMPEEEPPGDLRSAILSAIQAEQARPGAAAAVGGRRRLVFAAGWAMAALVVLTFLTLVRPPSDSGRYATMAPLTTRYESEDLTLLVWRDDTLVKLQPKLTGGGPVTIIVRWDPDSAAFAGVLGAADASSQNNQTTFTLHHPSQRTVVSLGVHPAKGTEVLVLVDGVEVIRAEIPVN
ncbi:MAG TPA: hypothetical protein VNA04_16445 [Thermoanaerobaculia bacterium]|nr:hypothetical protein [Thermoanaerobaculia bacterium]